MEEKKTKFYVWFDDFFGNGGREIWGYVNTFAEGQELLVNRCKKTSGKFCECQKEIDEILSHTEEEMVGKDEVTLYKSNCYFHEGIARVPGYVEDGEMESKSVTLGEILKRELADVGEREWTLHISENQNKFHLQIKDQDKVFVRCKYEHIVGLPTHCVDRYRVCDSMKELSLSEKDFPNVDWNLVSVEEVDSRLREYFLFKKHYYSEEEAVKSLPDELVLDNGSGTQSIAPYDRYGYHIVQISAYCGPYDNGQGVFVYIKRGDTASMY